MSLTDRAATRERKFQDPKSRVMRDGREVLKGQDWIARKLELWARSEGRCEHTWKVGKQEFRCTAEGQIPAHVIPRYPLRDDRMENLLCLCMTHDRQTEKQAWRKTRFGERVAQKQLAEAIREEKLPKRCAKHPRSVYFDEPLCPACVAQKEFLALTDEIR